MNLLNFLKKKQVHSLETLLKKAADEPAYRSEFIKKILTEKLVIITKGNVGSSGLVGGYGIAEKDTLINIFTFKDGRIPVFTSTDRIFDKGIIKEQVNFLELKGEDLFNLATGATFILNPYSDYGKEFLPDEIQRLLKGNYFDNSAKEIKIKKGTKVMIGEPAKYPTDMVKSLAKLFTNRPEVVTAYLGWIYDPEFGDPPHYIIAIETIGEWKNINQEAGFTAQQSLASSEIVDLIQIGRNGFLNDYFVNKTKPFYAKSA